MKTFGNTLLDGVCLCIRLTWHLHNHDMTCYEYEVGLSWQRHWQVMMYWYMSRCHNKDISNNVIFALKMS